MCAGKPRLDQVVRLSFPKPYFLFPTTGRFREPALGGCPAAGLLGEGEGRREPCLPSLLSKWIFLHAVKQTKAEKKIGKAKLRNKSKAKGCRPGAGALRE